MISSEVQRTLVKSPPELWAELSDPAALSRHLGALGDIRITRAEPEKLVEWEADGASGSVQIKPSAWGTKVTLSATREIGPDEQPPLAAPAAPSDEQADAGGAAAEEPLADDAGPAAPLREGEPAGETEPIEHEPAPSAEPEAAEAEPIEHEPAPSAEPEAAEEAALHSESAETAEWEVVTMQPRPVESRRGFFARLFDRLRPTAEGEPGREEFAYTAEPGEQSPLEEAYAADLQAEPESEEFQPTASTAIESLQARFTPAEEVVVEQALVEPALAEPTAEEAVAGVAKEPVEIAVEQVASASGEPAPDMAGELKAAEEVAAEEVTAVLTAVLDRLGAAHHRPFSRA
jgi:hypothetical protein